MGYEDVEEITRKAAYENVKRIINAIKKIRIKYYPNFANISEEDQRRFQELNSDLVFITSKDENLRLFADEVKHEELAKYEYIENRKGQNEEHQTNNRIVIICHGAIDAELEALSEGDLRRAKECQAIVQEYENSAELDEYAKKLIKDYKIKCLLEKIREKDSVDEVKHWIEDLKECCQLEYVQKRSDIAGIISEIPEIKYDRVEDENEQQMDEEVTIG